MKYLNASDLIPMSAVEALRHFLGPLTELKNVLVTGALDLRSLSVSVPVRACNCVFEGPVDAEDARFDRSVKFTNCTFQQGLRLAHARINGPLDLSGCCLKPFNDAQEMPFHDLHVEGCILATRLHVECGLNFSDLECGAAFRMRGTTVSGNLLLNSAYVEGEFDLSDCEREDNEPAARTTISGVLNCDCARIESRVLLIGTRLGSAKFDQAHIEGMMLLGPGLYTLSQAELGVEVEKGKDADGGSLSLLGAVLDGSLEIRGAKLHGALRVSNAKLGCNLKLTDALSLSSASGKSKFPTSLGTSRGGTALRVTSTSVQGAMILENVEFGGAIDASNSNVALFEIDKQSITNLQTLFESLSADKKYGGVLILEGFTFGELRPIETIDLEEKSVAPDFLQLLDLTKFDEGTYVNVENWLRRSAKDDTADEVFRKMREEETRGRKKWWKRLLYAPFGFFYDYGTSNWRACIVWLVTFFLSCLMFWDGSGLDVAEKDDQTPAIGTVVKKPDKVDAIAVVFRIHLPIIPWYSDPEWKPAARKPAWVPQRMAWVQYDVIANTLLVVNVVNVTLIIASLSGLLKRRGS